MSGLEFWLLGKFRVRSDGRTVGDLHCGKPLELLCYLLLFRERPHHRELLSDVLWGGGLQSRKYLRQALWQLHRFVEPLMREVRPLVRQDQGWLQLEDEADVWVDVEQIERAFTALKGVPSEGMEEEQAEDARQAVDLHRAELLEGWYQDWCVFERERVRTMYLSLLDKLLGYCEVHGGLDEGLMYGARILQHDRAHERTHWRMMRLYYFAGDRTAAMRQYSACATALREELGVAPSARTREAYEQVRADANVEFQPRHDSPVSTRDVSTRLEAVSGLSGQTQVANESLHQLLAALLQAGHLIEEIIGSPEAH